MPRTEHCFSRTRKGDDYFIRVNRDVFLMIDAYARIKNTTKLIVTDYILRKALKRCFEDIADCVGFEEDET